MMALGMVGGLLGGGIGKQSVSNTVKNTVRTHVESSFRSVLEARAHVHQMNAIGADEVKGSVVLSDIVMSNQATVSVTADHESVVDVTQRMDVANAAKVMSEQIRQNLSFSLSPQESRQLVRNCVTMVNTVNNEVRTVCDPTIQQYNDARTGTVGGDFVASGLTQSNTADATIDCVMSSEAIADVESRIVSDLGAEAVQEEENALTGFLFLGLIVAGVVALVVAGPYIGALRNPIVQVGVVALVGGSVASVGWVYDDVATRLKWYVGGGATLVAGLLGVYLLNRPSRGLGRGGMGRMNRGMERMGGLSNRRTLVDARGGMDTNMGMDGGGGMTSSRSRVVDTGMGMGFDTGMGMGFDTNRDMTPRDMTPRDMTPRDMTPRDLTPRDMTPRDMGGGGGANARSRVVDTGMGMGGGGRRDVPSPPSRVGPMGLRRSPVFLGGNRSSRR